MPHFPFALFVAFKPRADFAGFFFLQQLELM
jgi:hypothetical protein